MLFNVNKQKQVADEATLTFNPQNTIEKYLHHEPDLPVTFWTRYLIRLRLEEAGETSEKK